MNKKRPVNLDLRTIKQPLPAITSILHRITGIVLFFGAIFMIYALGLSLESEAGFNEATTMFEESFFAKLITWGLISALLYHMFAGVKHLIMDAGHLEEIESGAMAAKVTLALGVAGVLLAGVWVW
ncbi:succinate dehydrogenase, cytochrome b556 subunit [Neptunomonas phycophila]|uniref:Succinate dehydrogenase cytochrome b556 subunit n=1 Tax=Neptunomonas phycophila TaxID=1572645 RepID=A0AAW7XJV0_9GAMM|nr:MULTISPECIES: succinate dehydrogenase, cytochrome b556 subunit [Neptunomonas]MBT3147407.1 succinate dehydrogenase, cytochrome b556 subunit [Neptunomonas phycophila]MDN2660419.1 succinate dehydrogenase, cytochrome b556 subunit [Neptunomonas sp. CHC150]MDO6453991.1 succinate dehydrogenase, cytochrome b556 subunit [Neptunomonas phycophila]MDO6469516.1 succinate dehydrogenase, cytochrome b556 subunit [Neptunomonas phycophila]MDO6785180.1 succinate dehydrogenase, cytochrome b556 subunit [Neptuno